MSTKTKPSKAERPKLQNLHELTETVHSDVTEVISAIAASRPGLINLYRPTEPVPPERARQLANIIRVLLETNEQLRLHAQHLQRQYDSIVKEVVAAGVAQREKFHVINKLVREYTPVVRDDPEGDDYGPEGDD